MRRVAKFTISLDQVSTKPVQVNYITVPDTALPGVDFVPVSGTVTFPPGQLTKIVTVPVRMKNGITAVGFSLQLTGAVDGIIGQDTGDANLPAADCEGPLPTASLANTYWLRTMSLDPHVMSVSPYGGIGLIAEGATGFYRLGNDGKTTWGFGLNNAQDDMSFLPSMVGYSQRFTTVAGRVRDYITNFKGIALVALSNAQGELARAHFLGNGAVATDLEYRCLGLEGWGGCVYMGLREGLLAWDESYRGVLLKITQNDEIAWQHSFVGSGEFAAQTEVVSVSVGGDGEQVVAAVMEAVGVDSPGTGIVANHVVKFAEDGTVLWQRSYPGAHGGMRVKLLADGSVLAATQVNLTGGATPYTAAALLCLDSATGNIVWQKLLDPGFQTSPPSFELDEQGNIFVGFSALHYDTDLGVTVQAYYGIHKLDASGQTVWARRARIHQGTQDYGLSTVAAAKHVGVLGGCVYVSFGLSGQGGFVLSLPADGSGVMSVALPQDETQGSIPATPSVLHYEADTTTVLSAGTAVNAGATMLVLGTPTFTLQPSTALLEVKSPLNEAKLFPFNGAAPAQVSVQDATLFTI